MRILSVLSAVGLSAAALSAAVLFSNCYKPTYSDQADAGMAFRCYSSDNPPCPGNLVCCDGRVCGDNLMANQEGWCVQPPEPIDMSILPIDVWEFGTKTMYYGGAVMDPLLTGTDPDTGKWRCKRDDTNPNPTDKEIIRAFEPNDLPGAAIGLTNPLPVDPPASAGSSYEICPDKSAPSVPDIDVFKFRLQTPQKVIIELKYKVTYGDLDVGLFRMVKDPDTGVEKPQRVLADLTAKDDACIEANNLMAGTYYVAIRGTNSPEKPAVYSMNTYTLRVYGTTTGSCTAKKDGGV
jgi:hypothetical protein